MRIGLKYLTPALAAAAAAVAIAAAPTALAATTDAPVFPHEHTTLIGPSTGNNEINASPPVNFAPQYPYWEGGGYNGGYSHGGFGGDGHGGTGHR
jgi:hypothetical protein